MKLTSERLSKIMYLFSLTALIYAYGVLSYKYDLFPYPILGDAVSSLVALQETYSVDTATLYTKDDKNSALATTYLPDQLSDGLILVMGIAEDRTNIIRVIDRAGNIVHELRPDWFEIWKGDEGNFPEKRRPKSRPGAIMHGLDLMKNGDIVVNFAQLSTMRINLCGEVIWKLDNLGHHSVHIAEDGTIWAPAENYYDKNPTHQRNHVAPLRSWTIQHISPDGEILETIPVIDILRDNDLEGLLSLSTTNGRSTQVSGDTLHLNDIETFPSNFRSELFEAGDIMFSLRNINTVIVMDAETRKIKFRSTGEVLRHHDPDFMGGDVISIFDNHNLMPSGGLENQSSRIVEVDARTGKKKVLIDETDEASFFSDIMGVHQRLPNGNLLITSSSEGRAIETLPDGKLVWVYTNKLKNNLIGRLTMAMLLPSNFDTEFFKDQQKQCH